jgi:hypothetical protein
MVKLEQQKILLCQTKMAKVREGFEGGLYNLNEARAKVDGYQDAINRAEQKIKRLTGVTGGQNSKVNVEDLKKEL